jgi:hypothetical protein
VGPGAALYRFVLPAGLFTHSPNFSNSDISDDDEDTPDPPLLDTSNSAPTCPQTLSSHEPSPRLLQAAPVPPQRFDGLDTTGGQPACDPFPDPALTPTNAPILTLHAARDELE